MTSTTTPQRPADHMTGSLPAIGTAPARGTAPAPTQPDLAVVATPVPRRRPARSWGWWRDRPHRGTPLGLRPASPPTPDLRTQGLLASSWLARGLR